jgi:hypothetical protein
MPTRLRRAVLLTALGLSSFAFAIPGARAALGAAPLTPPADASVTSQKVSAAVMHEASSAAVASSYTIRQTTFGNGTVVREYLGTDGNVFGIAWSGPQMPDLSSLLGTYFPQYVAGVETARAARGGGHGPVAVEDSGLVVHSGGHMGAFSGEAWLPQALPAGVSGSDIQ